MGTPTHITEIENIHGGWCGCERLICIDSLFISVALCTVVGVAMVDARRDTENEMRFNNFKVA